MEKHWSVTSLVALALLGSFVVRNVEAHSVAWQNPPTHKGAPPPQVPKVLPRPDPPQVLPPSPPKTPQYPHVPAPPPKVLPRPDPPQVLLPSPPKTPQYPHVPAPPPKVLPRPDPPQVLPPSPPKTPQYPHVPAPPPKVLPHPERPQVLPPRPPDNPKYPHVPNVKPGTRPQYPNIPQAYHDHYSQEPKLPERQRPAVPGLSQPEPAQSCEVAQNVRVPCGGADISAAGCEAINCCFDGRQCYFGKAVTVQCTKDAQFIVVVARDATLPNIDLETISLLGEGQGCTHVDSNSEFAIYQFPVTACGSLVMEEPGVIIYENRMSSSFEVGVGPLGAITRDSHYDLLFQCRYIGTSVETVVAEVLPLDIAPPGVAAYGPIDVHLRLANGQCHAKGCNELDVAFTSYYMDADYPVTKVLRDPVYVEVFLAGKTDPNLVLTLGRCWTTTSSNPHSLPQWDILVDGCPYRDDRYMSALIPVDASSGVAFPTHCRRFLFKMFTFVDSSSMLPLKEQVYIHCSTAVCTAAPGRNCEPSCFRNKRDVKAVEQRKAEPKVVASVGPLTIVQQTARSA